jgi:WD40 repeat protein
MLKRYLWLGLILLGVLTGCDDSAENPRPTATPFQAIWQRPTTVITAEKAHELKVTGILGSSGATIYGTVFNANGQRYATLSGDQRTFVWNIASGQPLFRLEGNDVKYAFFLENDDVLLTINSQDQLQKWSLLNEELLATLKLEVFFTAITVSPDGRQVAIGLRNGTVRLYNTADLNLIGDFLIYDGSGYALTLIYHPTGEQLYTLDSDGNLRVWEVASRTLLSSLRETIYAPLGITLTPDLRFLATVSESQVEIYDLENTRLQSTIPIPPIRAANALTFSVDGQWLGLAADTDSVWILDAIQGDIAVALPLNGRNIGDLAFSPDRTLLVTGVRGGGAAIWDCRPLLENPDPSQQQIALPSARLQQVGDLRVYGIDWSPEGQYFVVRDERGLAYVFGLP